MEFFIRKPFTSLLSSPKGHAVIQLSRTIEDVKIVGIASQGKHEALEGLKIDTLVERGADYSNEVRNSQLIDHTSPFDSSLITSSSAEDALGSETSAVRCLLRENKGGLTPCELLFSSVVTAGRIPTNFPAEEKWLWDRTTAFKVHPDGVDIVLDCLCGEDSGKGYNLLKPMGRYILYGTGNVVTGETKSFFSAARSWWHVDKYSPLKLFDENKTLCGFNLRHLMYRQDGGKYVAEIFNKVVQLWEKGDVKPVIDSVWAYEDVTEAMQKMHDRKNVGKILLDPSATPKPKPTTLDKKSESVEKKDGEIAPEDEKPDVKEKA